MPRPHVEDRTRTSPRPAADSAEHARGFGHHFEPDPLLVDAALDGRIWATDLLYAERVWLVGQLTDRGDSIQMVMTRLRISRRTAQRLRAASRKKGQTA